MSVIPPACEGRDHLGLAPSTRRDPAPQVEISELDGVSEDEAARGLVGIAGMLQTRLKEMAGAAIVPEDARACTHAAEAATEIHSLLSVDG